MKEKEILKYLFVFFLIIFAFLVCEQLPTDVEVPNVSILSPKNSAGPYYGEVKIELKVSDNKGIEKIEIYIDNEIKSTLTSTPYIYIWDITESGKDGNFKLKVKAYDVSGNWKEAETNFKGHGKTTGEVFAYSFGDTISDRIPVLKWKKIPKAKYHLFVSDSSNFGTTVIFDSTVTDTSYQVIDPLALKTYYWKLRARFSKGPWSNWSQVRSFIIINYVEVTFKTTPSNLKVIVDSEEFKTPKVFKWNEGDIHDISSELIQPGSEDVQYEWLRWNVSNQRTFQYLVPDKDQTIEAELMTQYYLTTSENPDAGGDMTPSPPGGWFDIDTKVTVDATENAGYDWAGWSGALIDTIRPRNITMDSPKSITANFGKEVQITIATNPTGLKIRVDGTEYKAPQPFTWIENSQHRLSVDSPQSTGQGKQYEYTSWSDGGGQTHNYTVPSASPTVTANFTTQYYLTVNSPYDTPQGAGWYDSGDTASFSVTTPSSGGTGIQYLFTDWSGDYNGTNNPGSILMNGPKTVTANWKTQYYLTVNSAYDAPQGEGWYDAESTAYFSVTTQSSGGTGIHYLFTNWSGDYNGTDNPGSINMDGPKTVTVNWNTQYYLTTSENPDAGGDMTPAPPGNWYDSGAQVSVNATESAGYDWAGWSGALIDTIRPRNITMDSPKSITANFGKEVQITIATNPTGLKIRVDGTEYKAPQPFTWIENSQHRLSVDSPQSTGQGKQYEYTSWSDGGDQTHNYTVPSASQRVTAKFDIIQYTLTMQVSGEGTTTPQEGPHVYDSGTIVDIFATPANLYSFENWTGDVANRNDSNTTVTMDSNKQVTANFIYDPEGPEIDLNVTEINFQKVYITGDFIIYNRGDKDLTWNISYKPSWIIDISPSDGSIQRNGSKLITVTASRNSLNEGIHSDNIEISNDDPDGNENPKSLNVEIEECAPEVSLVSPSDDQDYWEFTNFKIEFTANAIDDNNDNLSVNLYIKRYSSSSWDNYSMTKNGSYYKKSIQVTLGYRYQWYVKASDGNDEDSTSNRTIIVFERVMSEGFEEFSTHNNECEDNDGYWDVERWTADSDGGLYKEISEKIKSTMQDPDDFTWGQNNNHQEGNYSLNCASVELDGWPDSNDWFPDNNEYYPNTSSRDYRYEACDLEGNHAVNLSQYNGEIQLHFRILCNIESNPDYDRFRIVVRKNGISWQQLYLGSYSTSWKREFIDISNVGGYRLDPFRLEFRCNRIGQLTGVFIDDMSIWATRD